MTLTVEICREGKPNIHGMQYTREVMESMLHQLSEKQFLGEFNPDYHKMVTYNTVNLSNASHAIRNPRITEDGRLLVDVDVLKTPAGKELEKVVGQVVPAIRGITTTTDFSADRPVTIDTKVDLTTMDLLSPDHHDYLNGNDD